MTELEMTKAFADLEGIAFSDSYTSTAGDVSLWAEIYGNGCYGWYNPITDLALTFKAMIKYDVDVIISEGLVEIDGEHVTFYQKDRELTKAIIECILKSRGLYK